MQPQVQPRLEARSAPGVSDRTPEAWLAQFDALRASLAEGGASGQGGDGALPWLAMWTHADALGLFGVPGILRRCMEAETHPDGRDLAGWFTRLICVLRCAPGQRPAGLGPGWRTLPWLSGEMLPAGCALPRFQARDRALLLRARALPRAERSPVIFGDLLQSMLGRGERRDQGVHYTSEARIGRLTGPLFMDALRERLAVCGSMPPAQARPALRALHARILGLRFLDPACGCGNILIVTLLALRGLEDDILASLRGLGLSGDGLPGSRVGAAQLHGIELAKPAARIARALLWITEATLDRRRDGRGPDEPASPNPGGSVIVQGNALRMHWRRSFGGAEFDYILGNPPFVGKHLRNQAQKADMALVFGRGAGALDLCAAWLRRAADQLPGTRTRVAFVLTSSLTQGEQVHLLWGPLLKRGGVHIHFAYRSFVWDAEGPGGAKVHCVIIGFGAESVSPTRLFEQRSGKDVEREQRPLSIHPYLLPGRARPVAARGSAGADIPRAVYGSKPVDGGALLLSAAEHRAMLTAHPEVAPYLRPLVSARAYLRGEARYCLWFPQAPPGALQDCQGVRARLRQVQEFRAASKKAHTRAAAARPWEFAELRQPGSHYVLVPLHSSELRSHVPLGFFGPETIVHNSCACVPGAGLFELGVLSSSMHMAWLRHVGGRIKSDLRYSNRLVYNTFPWPGGSEAAREPVSISARRLLSVRAELLAVGEASLATLYEPGAMPSPLCEAHAALDRAVDGLYGPGGFEDERARIEHLFVLYARGEAGQEAVERQPAARQGR